MKKCHKCNSNQVIDGYSERIIARFGKNVIKYFCQKCLTDYSNMQSGFRSEYVPKLRDTKIEKYLETINDYNFIPYADRWKTSSYYHYERFETVEK